jgi:hypothetical protein
VSSFCRSGAGHTSGTARKERSFAMVPSLGGGGAVVSRGRLPPGERCGSVRLNL